MLRTEGRRSRARWQTGRRGFPARLAVLLLAAMSVAGCSTSFKVLVKVRPDVEEPKAVDIVWVLTENEGVIESEINSYKKKGMAEYFRTGRTTLNPGFFRFYRFLLEGEPPAMGDRPLEVRSEPDAKLPKLYGPFAQVVPPGVKMGYLFIEYGKDAEALKMLPMMIYPRLPTYAGFEDRAPTGISIDLGRNQCGVIPFEVEDPAVIEQARRQGEARTEERRRASAP